ncbi:uro-adherence factor A-like [Haliotis asinina]|uniref:uro-adherence factor A-like n=1 Tax=Haliotis asinina TaxID=109174 RepID=UPI003531A181
MQNEPSANQNANDNDDNTSQDSYHLEGEERVGKGREPGGKSVTFSPEDSPKLKSDNDTSVINDVSASEKSTNHIDRLPDSQAADRPDLAKLNSTNLYPKVNGEIPPSACITASVYGREVESPQSEGRKDVFGENIVSASLKPDVDSFTDKRKYSADTDLIVDIPYTLHRRLKGETENKEETAFYKAPEGASTKESRPRDKSPGRPPTDSEPLKAVDIPLSPPLKHPGTLGKSSSLERSPSTLRRLELVSCHKLPSRTSYSSVDDTTSPSFEKEILKQLEDKMQDDETVPTSDEQCKTDNVDEGAPVPLPKAVPETSVAETVNDKTSVAETVNGKNSVPESENVESSVPETVNGKTNASEAVNGNHSVEKCEMTSIVSSNPASDRSVSASGPYVSVEVRKPQTKGGPPVKPAKPPREKRPEAALDPKRASSSSTSSESSAISSTKEPAHIAIDSKISVPASQNLDSKSPLPAPPSPILKDASPTSSEDSSNINTFGVPRTAAFGTEGPCMTENPQQFVLDGEKDPWFAVKPESKSTHMIAPNPQEEQKESLKVDSSGNPLIFDLPSPAAAFIYSDEDSPPSKKEDNSAALTFSTFRPEPGSDGQLDPSYIREKKEPIDSMKRRSLNRVEEEEEMTSEAITAVTTEPKPEPKRVSFHEDVDIGQSFHSDVSMMVMRSPVDDRDDSSFGGSCGEGMDSGDILDTLENICGHGSESDMTYSGSSGSESDTESDMDDTMAKEIYAQYAATKCLAESGKDMTIDSGVGELSEGTTHTREVSPLESLERLDAMDSSFVGDKDDDFKFPPPPPELQEPSDNSSSSPEIEMHPHHQKRFSIDPLANLEHPDIADIEYTTSESESDFEDKPPVKKPPPPPVAAKPKPEFIKEKFGNESQT